MSLSKQHPASALELRVRGLTFGYRRHRPTLSAVSATFRPGRTLLLGPNGAGKSTLMQALAGVLRPARGTIVLGDGASRSLSSAERRYQAAVCWLPQQVRVYPGLSAREHVAYAGWLKGMSRRDAWSRSATALARVDLQSLADRPAASLSGGQQQRLGIAGALVSGPRVLLLDEPVAALDLLQRERFRQVMLGIPDDTITIVSSHHTDDIFDLYRDVAVMAEGAVLFSGRLDALARPAAGTERRDLLATAYRRLVGDER
ncbi:MAG: ATP-binding cassette domain-containing protein [Microbacteriaceae bacterium]